MDTTILTLIVSVVVGLALASIVYLMIVGLSGRGEETVKKEPLLTDAFDDGYNLGYQVAGGSVDMLTDEEAFKQYIQYQERRSRWVR